MSCKVWRPVKDKSWKKRESKLKSWEKLRGGIVGLEDDDELVYIWCFAFLSSTNILRIFLWNSVGDGWDIGLKPKRRCVDYQIDSPNEPEMRNLGVLSGSS